MPLCNINQCRLLAGHAGNHERYPASAWGFFREKDKKKINKAGFATPRGGDKGAYQNHVTRSSKVIIPYERLGDVNLNTFKNGYVIRIFPEQYFSSPGNIRTEFLATGSPVQVGTNAFVLYRSHDNLTNFPPLDGWSVRYLTKNGNLVTRRDSSVADHGHYVLRITRRDNISPERSEGSPQGIFAPEYADENTNFLCKVMLSWLIIISRGSPYTTTQARHLKEILKSANLHNVDDWESKGITFRGFSSCPLCLRLITYDELHQTVSFDDEQGLLNAGGQIEGVTRSTKVNLFHISPLMYQTLDHIPNMISWGHAVCNTKLGQRKCFSLNELIEHDNKVAIFANGEYETFGWMSRDWKMIRSPGGAVWIQIVEDIGAEEIAEREQLTHREESDES